MPSPQRLQPGGWLRPIVLSLIAHACTAALAQSATLQGTMGQRALVIVGSGAPKALAPGETHQGVRVISVGNNEAVVELGGHRQLLRVGDAPASVGGGARSPQGQRIVLSAGSHGHFTGIANVNGRALPFMVDTGASAVALGATDAERVGLNFRAGRPVQINTANGVTTGWMLKLSSVRVGDVEAYEVDAIVLPHAMPHMLLGNSFLNRFQMKRDNDQMVLERRY